MALDEPRENDEVFDSDGITYVIDKGLFDQVKPIKVDFVDSAFRIWFFHPIKPRSGGLLWKLL